MSRKIQYFSGKEVFIERVNDRFDISFSSSRKSEKEKVINHFTLCIQDTQGTKITSTDVLLLLSEDQTAQLYKRFGVLVESIPLSVDRRSLISALKDGGTLEDGSLSDICICFTRSMGGSKLLCVQRSYADGLASWDAECSLSVGSACLLNRMPRIYLGCAKTRFRYSYLHFSDATGCLEVVLNLKKHASLRHAFCNKETFDIISSDISSGNKDKACESLVCNYTSGAPNIYFRHRMELRSCATYPPLDIPNHTVSTYDRLALEEISHILVEHVILFEICRKIDVHLGILGHSSDDTPHRVYGLLHATLGDILVTKQDNLSICEYVDKLNNACDTLAKSLSSEFGVNITVYTVWD